MGPAHMLFSEEKNKQLQKTIDWSKIYQTGEEFTADAYRIRFKTHDNEVRYLYASGLKFGYRYKCEEQRLVQSSMEGPATGESQMEVSTEPQQTMDSPEQVDVKRCMNDIVLLRITMKEAELLYFELLRYLGSRPGRLIQINNLNKLKFYARPNRNIPILIQGCRGIVVANTMTVEGQRAYGIPHRLLFMLDDSR